MNLFDLPKAQRDKILLAWGKTEAEYLQSLGDAEEGDDFTDEVSEKFQVPIAVSPGEPVVPGET